MELVLQKGQGYVSSDRNKQLDGDKAHPNGLVAVQLGGKALDVEDDLGDILLDTGDGGKLVLDTVDLLNLPDRGDIDFDVAEHLIVELYSK